MALILDLDDLNQGANLAVASAIFAAGTGADIRIHTSAGNLLPALAVGEVFEVREHSAAENNGLYTVVTVTTSTDDYECDKVTATAPSVQSVEAIRVRGATGTATELSVHFDIFAREVWLIEQGNLSLDGVTLQALYSFIKVEWKLDPDLIPHPFPMIAITPEQFEFIDDWNPVDASAPEAVRSRKLIRTGGWSEVSEVGANLLQQYSGVISLGTFEDSLDTAYFFQGSDNTDTSAAIDFDFANAVNEAVRVFNEIGVDPGAGYDFTDAGPDTIATTGDFVADGYQVGGQVTVRAATVAGNNGTYEITIVAVGLLTVTAIGGGDAGLTTSATDTTAILAVDNRNSFDIKLRIRDGDPNGKTFDSSDLTGIGVAGAAGMDNKVFRFPLANATDLKIAASDASIDGGGPWDQMTIRYFDQAYNREVDSATNRDFGIVIDVGTHSGVDGAFSAAGVILTTTEGGIVDDTRYEGGTLRIHEGADENTIFTIDTGAAAITATTVTITGDTFTATETNISFTIQRATPIVATIEEIYEFVQRQLRKDSDIDATDQVVVGRTGDEMLTFVGDALRCGQQIPNNPQGGGSGVVIEGFDSNDTNDLSFFDNTGVSRTFPFVAAGTINFNLNLQNDTGPAEFFMFYEFTERFTNTAFSTTGSSGDAAVLNSATTNLVTELADGDYIRLNGFAAAVLNGIWVATAAPAGAGPWTVAMRKVAGGAMVDEGAGATVSLDKNPIDSPDGIIVNDNGGAPIEGTIGAPSIGFDFDYDNNVQGGRTAATDADIVIRALGEDVAAFVEVFGTITRATGLSFSLVAPLERNFTNPA